MAEGIMEKQSTGMLIGIHLKKAKAILQNDENTIAIILSSFESWEDAKSNWINIKAFNKAPAKRPITPTSKEHSFESVFFANKLNLQQSLESDSCPMVNGIWVSHLLLVHERFCEECYTVENTEELSNNINHSVSGDKIKTTSAKCTKGNQTPVNVQIMTTIEPKLKKVQPNSEIKSVDDLNTEKVDSKKKNTISTPRIVKTRHSATIELAANIVEGKVSKTKTNNYDSKIFVTKEKGDQIFQDDTNHKFYDESTDNEDYGCDMDQSISLSNQSSNESDNDEISKTNSLHRYEFKCKLCEKSFNRPGTLRIHVDTHHGGKKFTCIICKKEYTLASSLKNHMLVHTEDPKKCPECGKTFPSSISMKNHIKTHAPRDATWKCLECGKTFFSKHTLKNHKVVHLTTRNFCCDICGKSFKRNDHLMSHRVIHTGEKVYSCDICGCTFGHSTLVYKHKKKKHGERDQLCNICGKAFFTVELLNRHTRTHSEEPHFKCQECGKSYRSESGFKGHVNTHKRIPSTTLVQRLRKKTIEDHDKNKQVTVDSGPSCIYPSKLLNVRELTRNTVNNYLPIVSYENKDYRYF